MKSRASMLAVIAALSLAATPALADRGYGGRGGGYGYSHGGGGHIRFWDPLGFLLGTAILFSVLQPRTVYAEPQPVYVPPPVYPPNTYVQPSYVEQAYATPPPVEMPPPASDEAKPPIATTGIHWWYYCQNPGGYYPYVQECPGGWQKVSPKPPGLIKP